MTINRKRNVDLMHGTLDLLILKTLQLGPLHGIAITDRIRQITTGTFHVQAGSLFPALHRLEAEGWIAGEWTRNERDRRVKSYRLTSSGKKQFSSALRSWERVVTAVTQVLESN